MIRSENKELSAVVIIPVYKNYIELTDYEKLSLHQCLNVLGKYNISLIKPDSLSVEGYIIQNPRLKVESFKDYYFKNVQGYNELMLSETLYDRFLDYTYMLIYQLDAFVFADELSEWCEEGFDYVGAPWLVNTVHLNETERGNYMQEIDDAYTQNKRQKESILPSRLQFYNKVGNGGFSLRNSKKFHALTRVMRSEINHFLSYQHYGHYFNEDVFWSLEVNRNENRLRIPDFRKACLFSLEFFPLLGFEYNDWQYPFGCHAWSKFPHIWREIFNQAGIDI